MKLSAPWLWHYKRKLRRLQAATDDVDARRAAEWYAEIQNDILESSIMHIADECEPADPNWRPRVAANWRSMAADAEPWRVLVFEALARDIT
jgi:hypothetical protein